MILQQGVIRMSNNEYLDFDDFFIIETKVGKEDKAILDLKT